MGRIIIKEKREPATRKLETGFFISPGSALTSPKEFLPNSVSGHFFEVGERKNKVE